MSEFVINRADSVARFHQRGQSDIFSCSCGGTRFSLWHFHNPYGDDMSRRVLHCASCGTEYEAGSAGSMRFEREASPAP